MKVSLIQPKMQRGALKREYVTGSVPGRVD